MFDQAKEGMLHNRQHLGLEERKIKQPAALRLGTVDSLLI